MRGGGGEVGLDRGRPEGRGGAEVRHDAGAGRTAGLPARSRAPIHGARHRRGDRRAAEDADGQDPEAPAPLEAEPGGRLQHCAQGVPAPVLVLLLWSLVRLRQLNQHPAASSPGLTKASMQCGFEWFSPNTRCPAARSRCTSARRSATTKVRWWTPSPWRSRNLTTKPLGSLPGASSSTRPPPGKENWVKAKPPLQSASPWRYSPCIRSDQNVAAFPRSQTAKATWSSLSSSTEARR